MRTQRQPVKESLDEKIRNSIQCNFQGTAKEIVRQVHDLLEETLTDNLKRALNGLKKTELEKIADDVCVAFTEKQMGLRELASMARKEIVLLLVKRSVGKYRADMMDGTPGMGPAEYFERYYKEHFLRCDIPANGISVIDANLHTMLRKTGQFPVVTKSLNAG